MRWYLKAAFLVAIILAAGFLFSSLAWADDCSGPWDCYGTAAPQLAAGGGLGVGGIVATALFAAGFGVAKGASGWDPPQWKRGDPNPSKDESQEGYNDRRGFDPLDQDKRPEPGEGTPVYNPRTGQWEYRTEGWVEGEGGDAE